VGVISSRADLRLALGMENPPDLFELRLDCLVDCLDELERKVSILPAPCIITARHPAEGGANELSTRQRRQLLERFLPHASYVDLELRSAKLLASPFGRSRKPKRIVSFHDLKTTPSVSVLRTKVRKAKACGADIFKVATRTDTAAELERLLDFVARKDIDLAISAMGLGKLGAISRLILTQLGSVLLYGAVGRPAVPGQLSIRQLRSALSALKIT
jgi:3-dehydroquinate dehydratase-1